MLPLTSRLQYSVGFGLTGTIPAAMHTHTPKTAWTPAYNTDGEVCDNAWLDRGLALVFTSSSPHKLFGDTDDADKTALPMPIRKGSRHGHPISEVSSVVGTVPHPAARVAARPLLRSAAGLGRVPLFSTQSFSSTAPE